MKKVFSLFIYTCFAATGICQTADFTWQSTSGLYCSPSLIKFTNRSTGNPIGYAWTFGNNNRSNATNPVITFSTAGTFIVKLIAIYKNKTVETSKAIIINPAVAAPFAHNRNTLCKEGPILFTANTNQPVSSYEWNFGDNSGIVSTNSAVVNHFYSEYGTFPVSLKATALSGCFGESFTTITVKRPKINATVFPVSGCIPAIASFSATVSDLPISGTVISYLWEFGDGSTPVTTLTSNISHTYQAAGSYTPKLRITTNEGCTSDYVFDEIAFGTPPINHIAYSKKQVVCGSESPWFVSIATNANKYFWNFGEGDTTTVTDTITRHKFKSLGIKTITVTPFYNDCPGIPVSITINVIGVIATFNYSNTCTNKKEFSFINTTQGNQSALLWNYGDGISSLSTLNHIHSFPDTGTFRTSLSITDSITGCSDSYIKNIYTANPILVNPDSSICKNTNTIFNILHNYNNPLALYKWDVIGIRSGPDNTVPLTVKPNIHGYFNHNSVIIINGPQYCPDTINLNKNIIVRGPQLDFTSPAEICLSTALDVLNLSKPFISSDIIDNWKWNYGINGQFANNFQPQPYFYPYWGSFDAGIPLQKP
jgi:PKD repeat protein